MEEFNRRLENAGYSSIQYKGLNNLELQMRVIRKLDQITNNLEIQIDSVDDVGEAKENLVEETYIVESGFEVIKKINQ